MSNREREVKNEEGPGSGKFTALNERRGLLTVRAGLEGRPSSMAAGKGGK